MIVIVGVGALGSHVLFNLRNVDKPLRVIDFDLVEMKNTQAQMHTKMGLRKNKAKAIQRAMHGMFARKIDAKPVKLTEDNAKQLLGEAALIIDCTDNIAARQVIMSWVREHDTPTLHGALAASGDFGQASWTEHFEPDAESGDGVTCEDGEHLPFFAQAGAHIASIVQTYLSEGTKRSYQFTPTSIVRLA